MQFESLFQIDILDLDSDIDACLLENGGGGGKVEGVLGYSTKIEIHKYTCTCAILTPIYSTSPKETPQLIGLFSPNLVITNFMQCFLYGPIG